MKYDYNIGDILTDTTFGSEWIVREKIPGGVKVQLNKEGGPFINATEKTCSMEFMLVRKAKRTMGDIFSRIESAIYDGMQAADWSQDLDTYNANKRALEDFRRLVEDIKSWHDDAKYAVENSDSIFEDERISATSIADDLLEALAALDFGQVTSPDYEKAVDEIIRAASDSCGGDQ